MGNTADVFVQASTDGVMKLMEKCIFVMQTKHMQRKINGSTSFAIDNMYYINFRI